MRIREVGERKVMTFILGNETTLDNNKCIITYKVFITFLEKCRVDEGH